VRALPQVGDHVAGYRIERQLGRGGMGVVYLAEQTRLRRYVALKLIVPEYAEDEEFRRRFERESQLAASLDHPNVVPVYEAGEADGALFISMRYVEGSDLRQVVRLEGRIGAHRAANLTAQLGAALDAAHARGLVHRDVKPANVLVSNEAGEEHVYLTDFGLTKHVSSQSGLTHTGQWVGTLDYVAPEQIQGGPLDARVDIYSIGCVLYQVLTGQVPYPKDNDVAKMYAHMHERPAPVTRLVPGLPASFDAVIERALAKRPDDRYPSAGDLGRAVLAAVHGQQATAPERSVAVGVAALVTRPREAPPTGGAEAFVEQGTGVTARLPAEAAGPWGAAPAPPHPPAPPPPQPWQPARPPGPPGSPNRPIVAAVAAALAIAGVAVALAASGVIGGKSSDKGPTTVIIRNPAAAQTAAQPTATTPAGPGTSTPTTPSSATGTQSYTSATYSADYPAGWSIVEDDVDMGAYTETKFQSPDASAAVVIDRTPGAPLDPQSEAEGVEKDTKKTPGYRLISFDHTTLGGRPGFKWVFDLPSGRRVDFFTNTGGGRFAVLGSGPDFSSAHAAARIVAESLR
jgi:protein kinase-like protein